MSWGNILAAGVDGWMRGTNFRESSERRKRDDEYQNEVRDRQRKEWSEADTLKADLKREAQPLQVVEGAGGATLPASMDARDIGQPGETPIAAMQPFRVGTQGYDSRAAADSAAAAANDPAAVAGRQAQVYQARGMPTQAATLEARQAALQKTALELKKNGVLEGVNALSAGNKDGAVKALKNSGMFQIDGDVSMSPEEIDLPGVGKIKTYNLTFNAKNPDGTTAPMTLNSHVLAMGMMPYEKQLDIMGKGVERESKADDRVARLEIAAQRADASSMLAEARAARLASGGGGGSGGSEKGDREYRLQLQNIMGNTSREIREIDASMKDLKQTEIPGRAASPQMQELVRQRTALEQRRSALNDEFVGLAEKKAGSGNSNIAALRGEKSQKTVDTPHGKATVVSDKAAYDRLPSGALYIAPGDPSNTPRKKK